jgi:hypothetical protein
MDNQDKARPEDIFAHLVDLVENFAKGVFYQHSANADEVQQMGQIIAERTSVHLWDDLRNLCEQAANYQNMANAAIEGKSDNFVESVMNTIDNL